MQSMFFLVKSINMLKKIEAMSLWNWNKWIRLYKNLDYVKDRMYLYYNNFILHV